MKWIVTLVVVVGLMAGAEAVPPTTRTIRTSQGDAVLENVLAGSSGGGGLRTLPEASEFEVVPSIVGGSVVKNIKKFPQVVAIVAEDKRGRVQSHCSGVIIDKKVVLSAAQCFRGLNTQLTYSACSGTVDIKRDTKNSKCGKIEKAFVLNQPDPRNAKFDFAVLRLSRSILSSHAKRVKVSFAKPKNGLAGFSVGFGGNNHGAQADGKMRSASAKVVLNEGQCKFLNGTRFKNDSNLICAKSNNAATCFGDFGGPLLVKKNNELICIGTLSLVNPRCEKGNESAYSSLYYKDHAKVFKAAVKAAKGKFLTGTLPKK